MMRVLVLCLAIVAGSVAFAACSGGGGDDDDDTNSPTPTPTNLNYCQVVWATPNAGVYDMFVVDSKIEGWTSGTKQYGINADLPLGFVLKKVSNPSGAAESVGVTTSGQFTLTLGNATTPGASVSFSDATSQTFFSLNQATGSVGMKVGSGGTGTFDGVWSDPVLFPVVEPGTGTILVAYLGTGLSLGAQGSYATCYYRPPAATLQERITAILRTIQEPTTDAH